MELYTKVASFPQGFKTGLEHKILMLGSCFVENIGKKLEENKFSVGINPFGTLYNPVSVASALERLLEPKPFSQEDVFEYEGVYHSFFHHSRFSERDPECFLENLNKELQKYAGFLSESARLFVTFGTSYVYRLKEGGSIVANCHKLPEKMFSRERLSVGSIVEEWSVLLQKIWEQVPDLKVIFTVSPIRHLRDGAHENQLSKSILLLVVDELVSRFPGKLIYFPAYEIILDELRDYRFYAQDMLHPSDLAINYIWEQFANNHLTSESRSFIKEWEKIRKAIDHKPFHPGSPAYKVFVSQTLLKMEHLSEKFPFFDVSKERMILESKLG